MSKASRAWKAREKVFNTSNIAVTPRSELTLKGYRKWRRVCNAYENGVKRHIACLEVGER